MKKFFILVLFLLVMGCWYFYAPTPTQVDSEQDEKIFESLVSVSASSPSTEFFHATQSNLGETEDYGLIDFYADNGVDQERDVQVWQSLGEESESLWHRELLEHLRYVDRDNAEALFKSYKKLWADYFVPRGTGLKEVVHELSKMNGESYEDLEQYDNVLMKEDDFSRELRRIFKDNYQFIENERKKFVDAHAQV